MSAEDLAKAAIKCDRRLVGQKDCRPAQLGNFVEKVFRDIVLLDCL